MEMSQNFHHPVKNLKFNITLATTVIKPLKTIIAKYLLFAGPLFITGFTFTNSQALGAFKKNGLVQMPGSKVVGDFHPYSPVLWTRTDDFERFKPKMPLNPAVIVINR